MPKKKLNPVDRHVGRRVRMRRKMLALSQEKLGNALGLTFQQVQKYENGANRIGASRLQHIAGILRVPVAFFFDGAPSAEGYPQAAGLSTDLVSEFMATTDGLVIAEAFGRIKNAALRRALVNLVEQIAEDQNSSPPMRLPGHD